MARADGAPRRLFVTRASRYSLVLAARAPRAHDGSNQAVKRRREERATALGSRSAAVAVPGRKGRGANYLEQATARPCLCRAAMAMRRRAWRKRSSVRTTSRRPARPRRPGRRPRSRTWRRRDCTLRSRYRRARRRWHGKPKAQARRTELQSMQSRRPGIVSSRSFPCEDYSSGAHANCHSPVGATAG